MEKNREDDDYMTTNRLLDQMAATIKQNTISQDLSISQDLFDRISKQLKSSAESANVLVDKLLNTHINEIKKNSNLLKNANQKIQTLQLKNNNLNEAIKREIEKTNKQIRENELLKAKLKLTEDMQNNYQSMEKALSTFQSTHQDNQKRILSLKQQNQKIKSHFQKLTEDLKQKTQSFIIEIRENLKHIKEELNKSEIFGTYLESQIVEFFVNQHQKALNTQQVKQQKEENNNQDESQRKQEQVKQVKQQPQSNQNQTQKKQETVNESHHRESKQKISSHQIQQGVQHSHEDVQVNRIDQSVYDQLNQYISNSLDPSLQQKIVEISQQNKTIQKYQESIKQLISYIQTVLIQFPNQKISTILTNINRNSSSVQSIITSIKHLKTVSLIPIKPNKEVFKPKHNDIITSKI